MYIQKKIFTIFGIIIENIRQTVYFNFKKAWIIILYAVPQI